MILASQATHFLRSIEDGALPISEAAKIADEIDPILLYFLVRYIREKYPMTNPASAGVLGRLVELTSNHPQVVNRARLGEGDAMREWFDESHSMKDFYNDREAFLHLIIDKLES